MPQFLVPVVGLFETEKLKGVQNCLNLNHSLELGLRSLNLLDYIRTEFAEGLSDLLIDRRMLYDLQAHKYVLAIVSKDIASMLIRQKTAFSAYERKITIHFTGKNFKSLSTLKSNMPTQGLEHYTHQICHTF